MVLDEADQMLERGFAESVEEVLDEVFHDSKDTQLGLKRIVNFSIRIF